jgi:hypothetical protein
VIENKRRYRARQKEYVLDLERRLSQSQAQGIQATVEMQVVARRVAQENANLRRVLREMGYGSTVIETWASGEGCFFDGEQHQIQGSIAKGPKGSKGPKGPTLDPLPVRELGTPPRKDDNSTKCCKTQVGSCESASKKSRNEKCTTSPANIQPRDTDTRKESMNTCMNARMENLLPPPNDSVPTNAPCRLLTLLAGNPSADITQALGPSELNKISTNSDGPGANDNGVECSKAYRMLMPYATSEEKMNKIAEALESGCTPSATGGCKVKNRVLWKVLDEECT